MSNNDPEHGNPHRPPPFPTTAMPFDATRFSFTGPVERGFDAILRDLESLTDDEFVVWPVTDAYDGMWTVFPFLVHCAPPGFVVDVAANRRRCPATTAILQSLPGLRGAAFSRLGPGSRVHRHRDVETPGIVRAHLGLRIPEEARMHMESSLHAWATGELLVFDGQEEHMTENLSDVPRDVLIMDFALFPDESLSLGQSASPAEAHLATRIGSEVDRHLEDLP